MSTQTIDEAKVNAFVMNAVGELGATLNAALVVIGDRLGLYKAMAGAGALTPRELADRTQTNERYVREWLNAQAAGGYVTYADGRYTLPAEHALALADEDSPAFLPGAFQLMTAAVRDEPKIAEAFKSGAGVGWHQHSHDLFEGCERFFRPGYQHNLTQSWIPALDGVEDKLRDGARVADVGCGHGASTLIMADAYPASDFHGFDYHGESIAAATQKADQRARFEVASAQDFPGTGYDLVTTFDCLHDMGDPVSAARHIREALADDGTWLLVEPFAGDTVEENLNPVGRVYYAVSTLVCTPASLSQEVGLALGAQAGEARLRDVVTAAGFTRMTPRGRDAVQPRARGAPVSRARYPDHEGYVTRDGVRLFYEVYGDAKDTILLLPTWSIIHSRLWKAQIAYLARHFRVITFDGRGNGKSDRPKGVPAYTEAEFAADALAVLDATRTDAAFLAGLSCGALWATLLAADHPSACAAWPTSGPPCRSRRPPGAGDLRPLRGGPARRVGPLGDVQPPLLARGLPRLPGVLLRPDVQRPALDQADRGLRALGAGDRPGDARGHDVGALAVPARVLRGHGGPRAAARCW